MIRALSLLSLPLLAAVAFAQPSADGLSLADGHAREVLAVAVSAQKRAALVRTAATPAAPAASAARVATLKCHAAKGGTYGTVEGAIDLATRELTSGRAGRSPLLDASKGAALVDERCGTTAAPIADSFNYYVTPPHDWGEDILQLPKAAFPKAGKATFAANLHVCSYDGDWHSSDDIALTCEIALP